MIKAAFVAEHPEETLGEENAWQTIVEALAGLCALHGLVDDHKEGRSLRGSRTGTNKALRMAMRGYRSAFPEEISSPGIRRAIQQAALRCADAFSSNVDDATDQEKADLRKELHANILDALLKEVSDPE